MKKFKYPLAIKGTKEQLLTFFPLLEELGYEDDPSCGSSYKLNDCLYLITNFGGVVDSIGFNQSNDGQMEVSADNPELVLALAAAVEGYEFHEGEYVIYNGNQLESSTKFKEFQGVQKISNISGGIKVWLFPYNDWISEHWFNGINPQFRKATKEEIINHFNMDTKCCGVSPQEKTYTVKESFVKAAHASACSEWKQKIEKEFPEMFLSYKIGGRYTHESDTYILANVGSALVLVNLATGNRFIEPSVIHLQWWYGKC